MSEQPGRAYTVKELDALRSAVSTRWLWGTTHSVCGQSRTYVGAEKDKAVEELVRTHMLAGHTAEDLFAEDKRRATVPWASER